MNDLRITEAFKDLAAEARPGPGRWGVIERLIRRRHVLRLVTGVTASALAVVALVSVVPRIGGALRGDRFSGPGSITTTSPGVTGAQIAAFRDEQGQFQISFPSDWDFNGFQEGVPGISLESARSSSAAVRLQQKKKAYGSFGIAMFMIAGSKYDDRSSLGNSTIPYQTVDPISGARTVRWEEVIQQEGRRSRRVLYRIDWTGRQADWVVGARDVPVTLDFLISVPTDESWEQYGEAAEKVVRSVLPLKDVRPERWQEVLVYTPWGRVGPGILYDEKTAVLVQFLDARAGYGDVGRVYGGGPLQAVSGYSVQERKSTGDAVDFTVKIDGGRDEVITVGADGSGDLKIREVRLVG